MGGTETMLVVAGKKVEEIFVRPGQTLKILITDPLSPWRTLCELI
jgi:hypothetical protein